MKQFAVKSLKLKNSIIIISVILPMLIGFLAYDLYRQSNTLRQALHERGIILAQTGAATSGKIISDAIAHGVMTEEQIFDANYIPIPNTSPQKYHTLFDSFTDENLSMVQDPFLNYKVVIYAVTQDINGYVPTHNSIYPKSGVFEPGGIGDNPARSKRIFNDEVGLASSQNTEPYLLQVYKRGDTGETMWDISSPIFVNGRHWGGFRVGFSMIETNRQIAVARGQILGGGAVLTIALIILIIYISNRITGTVKKLEIEADRIAGWDFTAINLETSSKDELGSLIRSFVNMVNKLRDLGERMNHSVANAAEYSNELQVSIKKAADTSDAAVTNMSQLSETAGKMESSSEAVIKASEKTADSLTRAEETLEKFLKQMKSSSVAMLRTSESVKELESHLEKIGDIIQFIALIADQANLLAQKAVTEMKSFIADSNKSKTQKEIAGAAEALVKEESNFTALAAEIQKRSQDAATATKGIYSLFEKALQHARQASASLEDDQKTVTEGYSAASEASQSVKSLLTDLDNMIGMVKEIISYSQQVMDGISSVNQATGEQTALVERFTSTAKTVDEFVRQMQEEISNLKT
ncbi:MAG: methyl-accepting chemotaxis protein [Desulfotomaculaceae bacterium]|nr:methyl-accepting chemotaxis protein [Desulfotomaculaceae bacterium]